MVKALSRPRSVVESPYMADRALVATFPRPLRWLVARLLVRKNVLYARAAVRDSVLRGEAPIASHLLFTQPGILRDEVPEERTTGIECGLVWGEAGELSAFYVDEGWSGGMKTGLERAIGRIRRTRNVPYWRAPWYARAIEWWGRRRGWTRAKA